MRFLFVILMNFILSLFQLSFFGELFQSVFNPNLVLAFSLGLLIADLDDLSLTGLFFGGILIDLLSFNIVGVSSLTMVGSVYVFSLIRKYLSKNWFVNFLMSAAVFFVYDLVVGNLSNVEFAGYLFFILAMFSLVLIFYYLIENFIGYLGRSGIDIRD